MIDTNKVVEKFLQNCRFSKVKSILKGDVLDFGGNEGELKRYVKGSYTLVNYDYTPMKGKMFDTIVILAVIEHIDVEKVFDIFQNFYEHLNNGGRIILTTPTPRSKWLLELLADMDILDKQNILEHKHYWNKAEIINLALSAGLKVDVYYNFQLGMNQFAIFLK